MGTRAPVSRDSRVVFSCGPRNYTVGDVIEAADFRGELDVLWREFRVRRAAEARAQEADATLDDTAIDEAAVTFRYRHDLITAEETEAWLDARGLSLAEFSEHFTRVEWGKEFGDRVDPKDVPFTEASAEEREIFAADLILSGDFDRLAERLAWRVAARAAGSPPQGSGSAGEGARTNADPPSQGSGVAGGWVEEMQTLEAAYRRRCEQRLTPDAMQRELGSVRLPLTRFEVELIELESRDAANEAFLCVRDDGMSMAEVAREGRYPFRQTELVLEQIPDDLQQKFLSLTPGSLLDPTRRDDGYVLTRLLKKLEPKLEQPEVRQRVEQRLLARHFADLSSGRIQWRISMNGGG